MSRRGRLLLACAVMLTMLGTQRLAAQAPPVLPSRVLQAGPAHPVPRHLSARRGHRLQRLQRRHGAQRGFHLQGHASTLCRRSDRRHTVRGEWLGRLRVLPDLHRTSSRSTRSSTADMKSSKHGSNHSHQRALPRIASARAWRSMSGRVRRRPWSCWGSMSS